MNANTSAADKGLKPYGMIHELVKFYNVPVLWVVKEGKAKDATDYVINGTAYSGSLFVISSEFLSSSVQTVINQWRAASNTTNGGNGYTRGFVTANQIPSDYTFQGAKTMTIRSVPLWTLDDKNGKISEKFIQNAGIPSSAYNRIDPQNLGACNDIFVMPHADPKWSTHGNLLTWNQVSKGSIWAGCHAISALENTYNPANISQQMNFLTRKVTAAGTGIVLPQAGKTSYSQNSLVLWDKHKDGTPAYLTNAAMPVTQTGKATPADDWVSQYLGTSDLAHTNGSEQIYMPVLGGGWRDEANVIAYDPTQEDVPGKSPGVAAVIVYGQAFGDPNRGSVMYESGHDINENNASGVAAMRAFFNWSFMTMEGKTPHVGPIAAVGASGSNMAVPVQLSV
ncbi:hypothetical protein GCM10023091_40400 [Ravibacter arvi]|uniref:Uncharacterized protein n=2 Tax=Ravibacter arvi TaxID=2051041 RepID=A0ABP8MD72_9BACT